MRGTALVVAMTCAVLAGPAFGADPPGTITTVAGGGVGDGAPATSACVQDPFGVAVDGNGNVFIADTANHRIRRVAPDGRISTVAGTGLPGFSGDGGPATSASLWFPTGVAVDGSGNLFVADRTNQRIRKVATDGTISTFAGNGSRADGWGGVVPASSAGLWNPTGVAVDGNGNLFIADSSNHRIRKVTTDGMIRTVAGDPNGNPGFSGDGGSATSAAMAHPAGVAVDGAGILYIADTGNNRVRKVATDGTISTVAVPGGKLGVAADGAGNLYIAQGNDHLVRRVAANGTISVLAGVTSTPWPWNYGFSGDGGAATSALLSNPTGVAVDASGNVFIADGGERLLQPSAGLPTNHRVRKVATNGVITTLAGNGTSTFAGDGGPAASASLGFISNLSSPAGADGGMGIALDAAGNLFIADTGNHRVRKVTTDGTISTVAGNGDNVGSGDGGPATAAYMNWPAGVAVDAIGNLFIAEKSGAGGGGAGQRVRKVAANGTISTLAIRNHPMGVAVDGSGSVYVADSLSHQVLKVAPDGTLSTIAGTGHGSFSGDGGPATSATLANPKGVALDGAGNLFIADSSNHRIRKVAPDGTISTVAGSGNFAFSGDGGPATAAGIAFPTSVAVDRAWSVWGAASRSQRVRKGAPDGTISTVAGSGNFAFSGDGGPATAAGIAFPTSVAVDRDGNLFIADMGNRRIRKVAAESLAASVAAPAAIVQECDCGCPECDCGASGCGTVHFVFDVVPGTADLLRVRDETGDRLLLEVADPAEQQYGVGPVAFPLGSSAVRIELLARATVVASAEFAVQIQDTVAPVISGAVDRTIELQGPLTTLHESLLGISVTDACDPHPTVTFAPGALGLGTTEVIATARDATGNTSTATFDVTIEDTTPPVFTVVPLDMERHCEAAETLVSFDVLAEDLSGDVTVACEDQDGRPVDPSGTLFDVGEHEVTCTAADGSGNTATWAFLVTVIDDEAPVIVVPADVVVGNEPGASFAYVEFEVEATDLCDPDVAIRCETFPGVEVSSGDAFPIGSTTVTCTARDHSGNEASISFNVTVEDREAPVRAAPAARTIETDCAGTPLTVTAASLGVTATDNWDPDPTVTLAPTTLGPGTTSVEVVATDGDGNRSETTVEVTVLRGPFEVRFLQPLDANVDNKFKAGQTVPVKVRVTCDNEVEMDVSAVIDRVERIDGEGTAIANEAVQDSGAANDDGSAMRPADGFHIYNLSTKGWTETSGARVRVTVRISAAGHVDTEASVVLKNR